MYSIKMVQDNWDKNLHWTYWVWMRMMPLQMSFKEGGGFVIHTRPCNGNNMGNVKDVILFRVHLFYV